MISGVLCILCAIDLAGHNWWFTAALLIYVRFFRHKE